MIRAIIVATAGLTWLLVVAQPVGGLVQALLMDRLVFGLAGQAEEEGR